MAETTIPWSHYTFNPWKGCDKVSPACKFCYAQVQTSRWGNDWWGKDKPRPRTSPSYWRKPLAWDRAAGLAGERRRVFCASWSDIFEDREDLEATRRDLWDLVLSTSHLDWLLLTKRPENIMNMVPAAWTGYWPRSVWAGTTIEDEDWAERRLAELYKVPAPIRFASLEPQLADVDVGRWLHTPGRDCAGCRHETIRGMARHLDWLIVGGESGRTPRPFQARWAHAGLAACRLAGTVPFIKQMGAHCIGLDGQRVRLLDAKGEDPGEWDSEIRIREFPA